MEYSYLLSGLIGAIIGAVIGGLLQYKGSIKAAEKSISALYRQDADRREEEIKRVRKSILNSLIAEIEENFELSGQNQVSHAKIKFITEAWSVAKPNIFFLDDDVQSSIRKLYVEIHKYNALVEYDYAKVSYGLGYLDKELKTKARLVKAGLVLCKAQLDVDLAYKNVTIG